MKRILTGVVLGGAWFWLLLKGSFVIFWLVMVAAGAIVLYEYARMVLSDTEPGYAGWLVALGLGPLIGSYSGSLAVTAAGLFLGWFLLIALGLLRYRQLGSGLDFLARTGFGFLYPGFCIAHLVLLRAQPQGVSWLLALTALTIASDTGAYYAGHWFGRRKLCPAISPGKTVAGALGGLAAGTLAGAGLVVFLFPELDRLVVVAAALVLVCVGVMGDLLESMLKRSVGVKDSGTILAGHGGLLDRIDSLLLAGPFLFYLLCFGRMAAF
ncbi:MAG: phosphatidate cytidylyltransferase [Desulfobacterales bacterium]|nr:phosphatidate cytidylyltransferase [Desulfobacterales bacterium]